MDFRVGQTVMLINRHDMNALVGSTAVIKRIDEEFLYIMWTTPQTQSDGAYSLYRFKSLPAKNEQLLFSFMTP